MLPCPAPGDLPNLGIEPRSLALQADCSLSELPGKPKNTGVGSLSLFKGSSQPRSQTGVSCIAGGFFTSWDTREAPYDVCKPLNSKEVVWEPAQDPGGFTDSSAFAQLMLGGEAKWTYTKGTLRDHCALTGLLSCFPDCSLFAFQTFQWKDSQPWHCWYLGPDHSLLWEPPAPCRVWSGISWPILTRLQKHLPLPSDKQKCLQKLSMSSGGKITPGWGPLLALKNLPEASLLPAWKKCAFLVLKTLQQPESSLSPSLTYSPLDSKQEICPGSQSASQLSGLPTFLPQISISLLRNHWREIWVSGKMWPGFG